MTREAEIRTAIAQPRLEIVDVRRVRIGKNQPVTDESEVFQRAFKHAQRAGVFRRHAGTADQVAGKFDGVDDDGQSRNRSLIEVFDRVCSSTCFTMTAQYRLGPSLPSGSFLPGIVPGTTTE